MSSASFFLLAILALILLIDCAKFRRPGARVLTFEVIVFSLGGMVIFFPSLSDRLAAMVGIGRGADFVLYLSVIWLVRESILNRYARWEDTSRLTKLVRVLAIQSARRRSGSG